MGSIRRVAHHSGEHAWQARWRDPAGSQRSKNFARRAEAERHLTVVEGRKLTGDYIDPSRAKIRFAAWLPQAESGHIDRRPSTKARDDSILSSLVLPTFGTMPIGSIHPLIIQEWVAELDEAGYAPATIRKAYQLLSRTLDAAVDAGLLPRSPVGGARLPKLEHSEKRFLSPTEITRLAEAIPPRFKTLVLAAAYTGARFGELAALDTDHYQPLRRSIRIDRTLSEVRGQLHLGQPKTRAAGAPSSCPNGSPTPSTNTWPPGPPPTGSSSPHPKTGPCDEADSEPATGNPPSRSRWENPCGSTTSVTATSPSSSPKEHTPQSSPPGSGTPAYEPSSTSTATSTKASTEAPPTPWHRHGKPPMWTRCGRGAAQPA